MADEDSFAGSSWVLKWKPKTSMQIISRCLKVSQQTWKLYFILIFSGILNMGETPRKLTIKSIYQWAHLFWLILGRDWYALVKKCRLPPTCNEKPLDGRTWSDINFKTWLLNHALPRARKDTRKLVRRLHRVQAWCDWYAGWGRQWSHCGQIMKVELSRITIWLVVDGSALPAFGMTG